MKKMYFQNLIISMIEVFFLFTLISCSRSNVLSMSSSGSKTIQQAIQGDWKVSQGEDIFSTYAEQLGTLSIDGNFYSFIPAGGHDLYMIDEDLRFLFESPQGKFVIDYWTGVGPFDDLAVMSPDDIIATCGLRTNTTTHRFLIRLGESQSLYLHSMMDKISLWSITKE